MANLIMLLAPGAVGFIDWLGCTETVTISFDTQQKNGGAPWTHVKIRQDSDKKCRAFAPMHFRVQLAESHLGKEVS